MRKPYIVGNWKMNLDMDEASDLIGRILRDEIDFDSRDVAVAPPFTYLDPMIKTIENTKKKIKIIAQNVADKENGAYTGEISPKMLNSIKCNEVIIGHSERRAIYGETDITINQKVKNSLMQGLDIILCVGESAEDRDARVEVQKVLFQLGVGLKDVGMDLIEQVTIAYEPVWAIGTGKTASPNDAEKMHAEIRGMITKLYGPVMSNKIRILYGGSVKPNNARSIMEQPNVDGLLVGGASLKAADFIDIIHFDR